MDLIGRLLFITNVARIHATLESKRFVSLVYTVSISETRSNKWNIKQPGVGVRLNTLLEYFQLSLNKNLEISQIIYPKLFLNGQTRRYSLREKCPNTDIFLVRIFRYSD